MEFWLWQLWADVGKLRKLMTEILSAGKEQLNAFFSSLLFEYLYLSFAFIHSHVSPSRFSVPFPHLLSLCLSVPFFLSSPCIPCLSCLSLFLFGFFLSCSWSSCLILFFTFSFHHFLSFLLYIPFTFRHILTSTIFPTLIYSPHIKSRLLIPSQLSFYFSTARGCFCDIHLECDSITPSCQPRETNTHP